MGWWILSLVNKWERIFFSWWCTSFLFIHQVQNSPSYLVLRFACMSWTLLWLVTTQSKHSWNCSHSWFSEFDSKHAHCLLSVGAASKVSPYWSQETKTCHSSDCFSIVCGQATATWPHCFHSQKLTNGLWIRLYSNNKISINFVSFEWFSWQLISSTSQ